MAMLNSALTIEELIELASASAKGLSSSDVLEANLVNILATCEIPAIVDVCTTKMEYLFSQRAAERCQNDTVLTAEKFISHLPTLVSDLVRTMEAYGGVNIQRGAQNWKVLESIMADADPEVKRHLEERDGVAAGIVVH